MFTTVATATNAFATATTAMEVAYAAINTPFAATLTPSTDVLRVYSSGLSYTFETTSGSRVGSGSGKRDSTTAFGPTARVVAEKILTHMPAATKLYIEETRFDLSVDRRQEQSRIFTVIRPGDKPAAIPHGMVVYVRDNKVIVAFVGSPLSNFEIVESPYQMTKALETDAASSDEATKTMALQSINVFYKTRTPHDLKKLTFKSLNPAMRKAPDTKIVNSAWQKVSLSTMILLQQMKFNSPEIFPEYACLKQQIIEAVIADGIARNLPAKTAEEIHCMQSTMEMIELSADDDFFGALLPIKNNMMSAFIDEDGVVMSMSCAEICAKCKKADGKPSSNCAGRCLTYVFTGASDEMVCKPTPEQIAHFQEKMEIICEYMTLANAKYGEERKKTHMEVFFNAPAQAVKDAAAKLQKEQDAKAAKLKKEQEEAAKLQKEQEEAAAAQRSDSTPMEEDSAPVFFGRMNSDSF